MAESPHGIGTITLKQLLREQLSPSFDENSYGYKGFLDLLYALEDVVVLKEDSRNPGGLLRVYPANAREEVSVDDVAPEATAPGTTADEAISADSVALEVTDPGATPAEDVSAEKVSPESVATGTAGSGSAPRVG